MRFRSIGNDIVCIDELRLNKSPSERFIDKVFTENEKSKITCSQSPELMVWLLWSVKESTFKAFNRIVKSSCYLPKKFEVKLENYSLRILDIPETQIYHWKEHEETIRGKVETAIGIFFSRTIVTRKFVYTCVCRYEEDFSQIISHVCKISGHSPVDQSSYARHAAIKAIAGMTKNSLDKMEIKIHEYSRCRLPVLWIDNVAVKKYKISLSHDGSFVSFAFL